MSEQQLRKVKGIWCKFNNQNRMSTVTLDEMRICCIKRGVEIIEIEGEFKHEVRQFQKPYDNQQAEQISLMV
ncbi:hypothetical protein EGU48_07525, partial [Acinetobacter baumannii]|uniref:hypothetical protein n=1 Tax=Acinetobacter baumannii TaxID=470 RepID=UPI000F93B2F2